VTADTDAALRPGANIAEYTVSDLAGAVKKTLEQTYGYVRLRGEVSGFRGPHSSGHAYFALKDDKAKIEAVIWRGVYGALRFKPQEGLEVIATGKVTTYPGSSKYQIVIEQLEPAGAGALMALLEATKAKLAAEGLFAAERKRKLPFLPRVVGIVTSPTGAVIRDMLHGFTERFPTHVVLWPVRVQGETCAAEVAAAIAGFNAMLPGGPIPRPDVLIVARGGGSLEDLWGFNEEIVARAAAASRIPLISAVGHETDTTLIDFVSDARAPTPTKAAEWAVPKYIDLIERTTGLRERLSIGVGRVLDGRRQDLRAAARGLPRPDDLVGRPRQRFDEVARRLPRGLSANTQAHALRFHRTAPKLHPRLLGVAMDARRQRLERIGDRMAGALARIAQGERMRLERTAGRLTPQVLATRLGRLRQTLESNAKMLSALSYQSVLQRGFALVRDAAGKPVRHAKAVTAGDALALEFADGRLDVAVTATAPALVPPAPGKARTPPAGRRQGSLF
jgi:exodeoxyribonuclease VII large subunit